MSEASNTSSQSFVDLKDVQYLLYLECRKRMKEDDEAIKNIVIDKANKYVQKRIWYLNAYQKYTELVKLSLTRVAIEEQCKALAKTCARTDLDIKNLVKMTAQRPHTDFIQPENRAAMRKLLVTSGDDYRAVASTFEYISNCKGLTSGIEQTRNRVEFQVENALTHGLDSFVAQFDRED